MAHHILDLMHAEDAAAGSGDLERWLALFTEDAVFRYPGNNPLSGEYRGHEGLREWRRRRVELAQTVRFTVEPHDMLASDEHGIQLYAVTAAKGGRSASWRGAAVYHVRDGRISEAWLLIDPIGAVDDFLSWAASA